MSGMRGSHVTGLNSTTSSKFLPNILEKYSSIANVCGRFRRSSIRARMTSCSPARSVFDMEYSSQIFCRKLLSDADARNASIFSSSVITPSPSASTIMDFTWRASASSSSVTSPSPSASSASSEISLSFCTSSNTAPTTTPAIAKKSIPTSKKNVCKNSKVSNSNSSSPRNSSDRPPTIWPRGPPVTMVWRKRPMKPSPPTSASIESMTGMIGLGVLCRMFSIASSHATSSATMLVMASMLHSVGMCRSDDSVSPPSFEDSTTAASAAPVTAAVASARRNADVDWSASMSTTGGRKAAWRDDDEGDEDTRGNFDGANALQHVKLLPARKHVVIMMAKIFRGR
mmetsp:Transcript_17740/g.42742  ORF Transcript_17740/g.42742 Transcript_17740/m.42742 type:complete len:342 (+) Transcript_17740:1130-2155(+)